MFPSTFTGDNERWNHDKRPIEVFGTRSSHQVKCIRKFLFSFLRNNQLILIKTSKILKHTRVSQESEFCSMAVLFGFQSHSVSYIHKLIFLGLKKADSLRNTKNSRLCVVLLAKALYLAETICKSPSSAFMGSCHTWKAVGAFMWKLIVLGSSSDKLANWGVAFAWNTHFVPFCL